MLLFIYYGSNILLNSNIKYINSNSIVLANSLTNNRVLYIDNSGKLNTTEITPQELINKQDKLIAGTGINIIDNNVAIDKQQLINEIKLDLLNMIYPVGSIYITIGNTNPSNTLGGNWSQVGAGYALWSATSGAGGTISAGLPNITGTVSFHGVGWSGGSIISGSGGAFARGNDFSNYYRQPGDHNSNSGAASQHSISFNAYNSNHIYGNSTTVQPPAYKVYIWRRDS